METAEGSQTNEPLRIGGWLILIAIGIVITPVRLFYFIGITYPPIFTDGTWELITTQGSAVYSPLWGPILIGEIVINLMFALVGIYLAYLFFTKRSVFPKWYLGLAVTSTAFILVDAYIVSLVLPEMELFDSETVQELIRGLITLCIWSPYLFLSQRAKNTFIRERV